MNVGADVGGGSAGVIAACVAGVCAGDGVAVAAFYPSEGRVPEPMRADLLCGGPWELLPEPGPEVVVAAGSDWTAVPVPEQSSARVGGACAGMVEQVAHQAGRDGLPSSGVALLAEQDKRLVDVEVARAEGECAAASAGCLGM